MWFSDRHLLNPFFCGSQHDSLAINLREERYPPNTCCSIFLLFNQPKGLTTNRNLLISWTFDTKDQIRTKTIGPCTNLKLIHIFLQRIKEYGTRCDVWHCDNWQVLVCWQLVLICFGTCLILVMWLFVQSLSLFSFLCGKWHMVRKCLLHLVCHHPALPCDMILVHGAWLTLQSSMVIS
jgi:hypothetical protein